MKQITWKQITQAVERNSGKHLDTLVKRNEMFPREAWVNLAIFTADRTGEVQWEKIKEGLRDRAKTGRKFVENFDNQSAVARARGFGEVAERLKPLAESLRNRNDIIGKILRDNGKNHNHTLIVLLNSILKRNKQFNCWEALSHVIAQAYIAAGRERDAKHMTADKLLKTARRHCKGVAP
jgi:hypothetical protein